jgi:hypothetical protein
MVTFRCSLGALFLCISVGGIASGGQDADQRLRFVVYGGTSGDAAIHRALVAQMVKLRPDLAVHTGELVADGRSASDWDAFDEITKPLRSLCPLRSCRGTGGGGQRFGALFPLPKGAQGTDSYYSFDLKGVHFVLLDTTGAVRQGDAQTQWLTEDLAAAGAKPIVVVFHRPMVTVGKGAANGDAHFFWHPLFVKHKVRVVFAGGDRLYFRTAEDGVAYIVTGAGGGILSLVEARRRLLPTDVAGSYHHFIEMTVSGQEMRGRAVDPDGRTRDEFLIPPSQ